MTAKNNIIAIASGKGGVGKTWLSITLAHALAKRGKKILIFDGDLGLANIDVQLGLTPQFDLGSVVEGKMTLERVVTRHAESGFDVIAGRSGAIGLASLPSDRLQAILDELKLLSASYDYVLLDISAGIDRAVRQLASVADTILIVANDEPTSLTDAYAFIKLSYQTNKDTNYRIVVNSAANATDGQQTYQALEKACRNFLKFSPELAGIVRRDPRVKESIRNQTSILTRFPSSEAAADIEKLAAQFN